LKQCLDGRGYYILNLCQQSKAKTTRVHQLVANAFLANPENKKCVDHIENDKVNNNVTNLRWATISENAMNSKIRNNCKSGCKGVNFYNSCNKWRGYENS